MAFNAIFDPVFLPLLRSLGPTFFIILLSLIISVIVTLAYKFFTDQQLMKSLKEDIKRHQAELKKHKDNPKKMMEIQKSAWDKNLKYMTSSLKPSLITILPLLLVFGWLNSHMAYEPLHPNTEFAFTAHFVEGAQGEALLSVPEGLVIVGNASQPVTEGKANWNLKGNVGEYLLDVAYNDVHYTKDVVIQKDYGFSEPKKQFKDSIVTSLEVAQGQIVILNLFGWKIGFFGTYILFSIIFSMLLRKIFKIY